MNLKVGKFTSVKGWDDTKLLAPVYDNDEALEIEFEDKYFTIARPSTNAFNKVQASFKSTVMEKKVQEYATKFSKLAEHEIVPFVAPDGTIKASINKDTAIYGVNRKKIKDLSEVADKLDVYVVLGINNLFIDKEKDIVTMPVHVKTLFIIKEYNEIESIDVSKLTLAE